MKYLFFVLVIFLVSCKENKIYKTKFEGFYKKDEALICYFNEITDQSALIKRNKNDSLLFVFKSYPKTDDSINVFFHGVNVWNNYTNINNDITFKIQLKNNTADLLYVEIVNQKRFIAIDFNNIYPLCEISLYKNHWQVEFRKSYRLVE